MDINNSFMGLGMSLRCQWLATVSSGDDQLTELLCDTEDSLLPLSLLRPPITHHDRLSSNVREMLSDLCLFRGSPDSSSTDRLAERWRTKIFLQPLTFIPNKLHICWLFRSHFSTRSDETDFRCPRGSQLKTAAVKWRKKRKKKRKKKVIWADSRLPPDVRVF